MLIGIDFDNTIACYDQGFLAVARDMALVPPDFRGGKKAVRDFVRAGPGGDVAWQRLQARLYGRDIGRARLTEGVKMLLERARQYDIPVVVVSHKTQFSPYDETTDLRLAATAWMKENGLFNQDGMGVRPENVFFEGTRAGKISRIAALGCTHFIDDLDEVFNEPEFPGHVRAYLYAAGYDELPAGPFRSFRSHREIANHLFGADPVEAAASLTGIQSVKAVAAAKGGNNRLYRVTSAAGMAALKSYPSPDDDKRDRLGTEYNALKFLKAQREEAVPAPLAMSREKQAALYEWIKGEAIADLAPGDIDAALAFLARLHAYRNAPGASALPLASEACLSTAEILRQLDRRAARLTDVADAEPELAAFLARWRATNARPLSHKESGELPPAYRTLSPSDFGFHNALRRPDGRLVFVDFEYFGWDDPVKLTADFLLHPGMVLDRSARSRFARGMIELHAGDKDFRARLERDLPLYALRWCLILLNEFLPGGWMRRALAGKDDRAGAKTRQLQKADAMLARAATSREDLP